MPFSSLDYQQTAGRQRDAPFLDPGVAVPACDKEPLIAVSVPVVWAAGRFARREDHGRGLRAGGGCDDFKSIFGRDRQVLHGRVSWPGRRCMIVRSRFYQTFPRVWRRLCKSVKSVLLWSRGKNASKQTVRTPCLATGSTRFATCSHPIELRVHGLIQSRL